MAAMTKFKTKSPDDPVPSASARVSLKPIPWKGLNGEDIPPTGYPFQPPHILMQKEVLAYLLAPPGEDGQQQVLTDTARALYENVSRLFSAHGLPLVPPEEEALVARGKSAASALKKLSSRLNKPLLSPKPLADMIGITLIFPDQTDMAEAINLLRAAFPTDDVIRLDNGEVWETVHDGRNERSAPLYRCYKVNFVFAPHQMAEAQLMTESEYRYAQATSLAYHQKTALERTFEKHFPDGMHNLRAALAPPQDVTELEQPFLLGRQQKSSVPER